MGTHTNVENKKNGRSRITETLWALTFKNHPKVRGVMIGLISAVIPILSLDHFGYICPPIFNTTHYRLNTETRQNIRFNNNDGGKVSAEGKWSFSSAKTTIKGEIGFNLGSPHNQRNLSAQDIRLVFLNKNFKEVVNHPAEVQIDNTYDAQTDSYKYSCRFEITIDNIKIANTIEDLQIEGSVH